jgi:ubiquitin C-terminal hydrolase
MSCGLAEGITIAEQSAAFIFTVDILQMVAAYFSEMVILINSITQSHIQEDHDLYTQSSQLKGTNCWQAPGYCTQQN